MSEHESSMGRRARAMPVNGAVAIETGPVHFPSLSPMQVEKELRLLGEWVDNLRSRYPYDLDTHVIPNCWFRHESHLVALLALRDHERISYDPSSPASGAVDWHRALRDTAALLRTFTTSLTCTANEHLLPSRPIPVIDQGAFDECVLKIAAERRRSAVELALDDSGAGPEKGG